MGCNIIRCFLGKCTQTGNHILRTEGAVQAYTQDGGMLHTGQECFQGLTAQQSARLVTDCHTQHQGDILSAFLTYCLIGMDAGFTVQRIEYGLQQNTIRLAVEEYTHLFLICLIHIII